jgi:hypothetical protein
VNRAIMGDLVTTLHSGDNPSWTQAPINGVSQGVEVPYIQSFAWRDGDKYAVVLFNLDLSRAHRVRLVVADTPSEAPTLRQIAPASIHDDNEDAEKVYITSHVLSDFGNPYDLVLPKHSVTAVLWPGVGGAADDPGGTPLPGRGALVCAVALLVMGLWYCLARARHSRGGRCGSSD